MRPLGPPEIHHLNAAIGWLELKSPAEARLELAKISPAWRTHSNVLQVWWEIESQAGDWPAALEIAREMIASDSGNATGWISQSYALHELKRTREAKEFLLAVKDDFSKISIIPYNLACYSCRLGQPDEAMKWLLQAIAASGASEIKEMALRDPDLDALRDKIAAL